ncbi:MAG: hypothetical protein Greene041679_180 [Parcubacteria group bacterium Greene0416_79]|nr:MAG: hypothetical protein Greene041679_180 [Parcubacteria group bacterium Greene0416_79]
MRKIDLHNFTQHQILVSENLRSKMTGARRAGFFNSPTIHSLRTYWKLSYFKVRKFCNTTLGENLFCVRNLHTIQKEPARELCSPAGFCAPAARQSSVINRTEIRFNSSQEQGRVRSRPLERSLLQPCLQMRYPEVSPPP